MIFTPQPLKAVQDIVFTHGVWIGRQQELSCPDCISETMRCNMLVIGRDIVESCVKVCNVMV